MLRFVKRQILTAGAPDGAATPEARAPEGAATPYLVVSKWHEGPSTRRGILTGTPPSPPAFPLAAAPFPLAPFAFAAFAPLAAFAVL